MISCKSLKRVHLLKRKSDADVMANTDPGRIGSGVRIALSASGKVPARGPGGQLVTAPMGLQQQGEMQ
jgi:hypothetical protein